MFAEYTMPHGAIGFRDFVDSTGAIPSALQSLQTAIDTIEYM